MNRLWVRLTLAFVAVTLLGFLTTIFSATYLVTSQRLQDFLTRQVEQPDGLLDTLAEYYQVHGNWQDVDILLTGADAMLMGGSREQRMGLVLLDREQAVIYRQVNSQTQFDLVEPVNVEGEIVGYLALTLPSVVTNETSVLGILLAQLRNAAAPPTLLQEFSRFLLQLAAFGGLLGLIFGVIVSRTLSAPLNRLAQAAQAIGARQWTYRVPIRGSEEIQAVARSFNEMAASLEKAETLRRNLLADVAHELRTPLTVLQGNLRAILDGVYPLTQSEVARLYDQTRHLHRLVADLHTLAQAEAGQLPLHRQTVDLAEIAAETVSLFEPLSEAKGVHLSLQKEAAPILVSVDQARFTQVLQNLLNNALRHTPSEGTIRVHVRVEGGEVKLSVSDSGEGIAPEHLDQIFERFFRADLARSRDSGGAGLGLPIANALIKAHGGRVTVESQGPGRGATFTVWLPRESDQSMSLS
jgi:signal transduction histidine kinase